jgi:hypothetical protein
MRMLDAVPTVNEIDTIHINQRPLNSATLTASAPSGLGCVGRAAASASPPGHEVAK